MLKMKKFYSNFLMFGSLILFSLFPAIGASETSLGENWVTTDMSKSRLISAKKGSENSSEIYLGLQIQLDKGWKTYWRNPGDAGLPPQFNWTVSDNVKSIEVLWPKPEKFEAYGFVTWGYEKEVVFPIRVTLNDPTKGLDATLKAFYGICEEICVPVNQEFSINLPGNLADNSEHAPIIEHYQSRVPTIVNEVSPIREVSFLGISDKQMIVELRTTDVFDQPHFILEGEDGDYFTIENTEMLDAGKYVKFAVEVFLTDPEETLKGRQFNITILDTNLAVEGRAIVQ